MNRIKERWGDKEEIKKNLGAQKKNQTSGDNSWGLKALKESSWGATQRDGTLMGENDNRVSARSKPGRRGESLGVAWPQFAMREEKLDGWKDKNGPKI